MPQDQQTIRIIKDETFNTTYQLEDYPPGIYIFQKPYLLEKENYIILTKVKSTLAIFAFGVLGFAIALSFEIVGKYVYSFFSKVGPDIEGWRITTQLIAILVSMLLFILNACLPNEKKDLLKKIGKHFQDNQKGVFTKDESD